MNICVYGASSSKIDPGFIAGGEELGRKIAKRGHGLVFGGGGTGMMGAVARGCLEGGAPIVGVTPDFFEVDGVLFDHCTKIFRPQTMRQRKQMLETKSDGFLITPGGIGTFDEFFEILTLKQLGQHNKPIVVYNLLTYFDQMVNLMFVGMHEGFIREECAELYYVTQDADDALDYLEQYRPTEAGVNRYKDVCQEHEDE